MSPPPRVVRVRAAGPAPPGPAEPTVVLIDGSVEEWRGAGSWSLAGGSIALAIVRAGDEPVESLAGECDLRALLRGRPAEPHHWNLHASAESELEAWIEAIGRAVQERPLAAGVFAGCLRITGRIAPRDGLVVESLAYSMLQSGPEHQSWLHSRTRAPRR